MDRYALSTPPVLHMIIYIYTPYGSEGTISYNQYILHMTLSSILITILAIEAVFKVSLSNALYVRCHHSPYFNWGHFI